MRKTISILLVLTLLAPCAAVLAETDGETTVPVFLIPSEFTDRFNAVMEAMADQYADQLGEDNVRILKEYYTLTEKDPQGQIVYYGTKNWQIEAAFYFPDNNAPTDTTAARLMNIAIKKDVPEIAASLGRRIFELMIAYEYQDKVPEDDLHTWFETVSSPEEVFSIPGYTVNAFFTEDYTQYAVLPAGETEPDEITGGLTEGAPQENTGKAAWQDEGEWTDYHCEEDGFTTKKPYDALTQYRNDKGYAGIAFYLDVPGAPPYVMLHRRPAEYKFNNPERYLNNTYREFLEDKYTNASVACFTATTWEIGGKQLIGAKYIIKGKYSETVQLQLIEVRELGDVEYTAMYSGEEEEALTMKALEAAVANYAEDEAQKTGKEGSAGLSAGRTAEEELSLMTINLDGKNYTLGQSTPADLVKNGWDVFAEDDGTMVVCRDYLDGMMFVNSEKNVMDRPIVTINAMWADDFPIEYCEFDGIVSPSLAEGEDPDQRWNREYPYEVLVNAWEDDSITIDRWGAMCNWLEEVYGAKQNEEGIWEARVPLSDGRTLYISSHDSPVCISLTGN